jgi:glycerol uptake facilitator-like aquaporin
MILTAFFVSVILTAKYLNGAKDLFLNGLVIGLTLFTVICIGGGLSGGCFNPAVGLVQPLFQSMVSETDNLGSVKNTTTQMMFVYMIAPAAGGLCAGIFSFMNKAAQDNMKKFV